MRFQISLAIGALLSSGLVNGLATPEKKTTKSIWTRDDDGWAQCTTTDEGRCTIFMATGKEVSGLDHDYRTFAIFDHECELKGFYKTTKDESEVRLESHLDEDVNLEVDESTRPKGKLMFNGNDFDLGDKLDCYDYEGKTDGDGCRRHFDC